MNTTPTEEELHDALRRRVDALDQAPLSFTDVRHRARRIQRRRTIAAGVAVAAALAVAVPVGLALDGPTQRTTIPPATQTPQVTGPVRVDPRSADAGDAARVPLVVTGEDSRLLLGGEELALPAGWDQITPYGDGWLATRPADNEGRRVIEILTDDFTVADGPFDSNHFTVSADGATVAWPEHDGTRWQVVTSDLTRQTEPVYTALPGSREAEVRTVGFVTDDEVVVTQIDPDDGMETTLVITGEGTVELPGFVHAASASPVTGMVAGRISVSGADSCSGVVDGRARTGALVWDTCDHELGPFSPGGGHLAAFADVPDGPSPTLTVLDAATGGSVIEFEVTGARNRVVGIAPEVVWEDDRTLLATYVDGNQQYVVRLGLDGTVERVAGPVTNDDWTLSYRLTPGRTQ